MRSTHDTIVSLQVRLDVPVGPHSSYITLPNLVTLDIEHWHYEMNGLPLKLKTPKLRTYSQWSVDEWDDAIILQDLEMVEYVSIDQSVTLSSFPRLRILQLLKSFDVSNVMNQLSDDSTLSPNLGLIEVEWNRGMEDHLRGSLNERLDEINRLRPVKIQLMLVPRCSIELPNAFKGYNCKPYSLCTDDG